MNLIVCHRKRKLIVIIALLASIIVVCRMYLPVVEKDEPQRWLTVSQLPLCIGGVLDRSNFRGHNFLSIDGDSSVEELFEPSIMIKPKQTCRLHRYTMQDALYCLTEMRPSVHIAFIGDSRVRQQFLSYMKFIPDYDRSRTNEELEDQLFHNDANVTSKLLGDITISFRWRPEISRRLKDDLLHWISRPNTAPDFILIGVGVWYMRYNNHQGFIDSLTEIAPILEQLNTILLTSSNVVNNQPLVWINQYPSIDNVFSSASTGVSSEKIHHYNQATKNILKNSGIQVWDSSSPMEEDYVRACVFNHRHDGLSDGKTSVDNGANYNCEDSVHAGKVVVMQKAQILYNHLCNHHIETRNKINKYK